MNPGKPKRMEAGVSWGLELAGKNIIPPAYRRHAAALESLRKRREKEASISDGALWAREFKVDE